ncbi:MAG: hypothetical protein ACLUKN_08430 [Bacilli bacterium]
MKQDTRSMFGSEGYGVDNVVVRNCKFDTVNSATGKMTANCAIFSWVFT